MTDDYLERALASAELVGEPGGQIIRVLAKECMQLRAKVTELSQPPPAPVEAPVTHHQAHKGEEGLSLEEKREEEGDVLLPPGPNDGTREP